MLGKLNIGARLALCFGALVALMLILSALSYQRLSAISTTMASETSIRRDILQPLYDAREALAQTGIAARNAYIYTNEQDAQRELAVVEQQKRRYLAALDKLAPHMRDSSAFHKVREGLLAMAGALARPAEFRRAGTLEAYGKFLVDECSPLRRRIVADMDVVVREVEARLDAATLDAERTVASSVRIVLALAALALVLSVVLALRVTRSIVAPLKGAVQFAEAVSHGDLTSSIDTDLRDETGELLRALNGMQRNLGAIVRQVRAGTVAITTASSEVNLGNQDLSSRTEQAASSLQETAASVEQLTCTVKQNAANARQANTLAETASSVATRGGKAVDDMVGTMDEIQAAAVRIGDIVGVIDSIAFQTNILALNAAVEAARAGEQGRGFAVVAAEVRNLAQRSAAAAHEIKGLIQASSAKVAQGNSLAQAAGSTMQEVVDSVRRVSGIINEIAASSDGQSSGIESINEAIGEVDRLTQQNAALVEQAAAASQTMLDEAGALAQQVSVFRVDGAPAGASASSGRALALA